ncbi:zinc metallochaperone AztD [Saccharomonospora saliphila]|uniref:zinc metallochaperone AztD n=1 Tax=Saccharomonospora saliphila TaxID=369829 RepID=UPI0003659C2B|nr:zinc metallochaperone AztD [Saccharomonospora saliphila]
MASSRGTRRLAALSAAAATLVTLGACGAGDRESHAERDGAERAGGGRAIADPVVATYDGGVYVLDGTTLEVEADVAIEGFTRVNPAGDDRHVLVSTSGGFRVLDAVGGQLTDVEFPGAEPGHVVRHAGRTVLFTDGTGEVRSFDPHELGGGTPDTTSYTTAEPHHGVAVELDNGELLVTLGTEEERTGIRVLDAERNEIARNEECPGVHGEATARGGAVVVGCEDGVLVYRDGVIEKIDSPTEYGRIGNQAGTEASPIVLGDYKQDEDAELERPTRVSLIDTEDASLRLVELGTSYTFRSLARGPEGEALVLGTDGAIHVLDQDEGTVVRTIPVLDEWEEPLEWQEPRPAIFVRGGTAFVSDPGQRALHAVDLASGETTASVELERAPNELSGVVAQGH